MWSANVELKFEFGMKINDSKKNSLRLEHELKNPLHSNCPIYCLIIVKYPRIFSVQNKC